MTTTSLDQFNISGGLPSSSDLAPAIVFLVIYAFCLPVLLWRIFTIRKMIYLRPSLFILCRLGTFGLRAYMAKNSYNESEVIAEMVLVSIGFLFLIEPVITCWKLHVDSAVRPEDRPRVLKVLATGLKVGLIIAIATAIASSTMISDALDDSSEMDTVNTLRKVSLVLSLVVIILLVVATIVAIRHYKLHPRPTIWLFVTEALLFVIAIYKLIQNETSDTSAPVRSRAAFWILQITFELLAFLMIIGINMAQWFPGDSTPAEDNGDGDLETGRRGTDPSIMGSQQKVAY